MYMGHNLLIPKKEMPVRRRRRKSAHAFPIEHYSEELSHVRLIVCHIIKSFNLASRLVYDNGFAKDSIAQLLGLSHLEERCYDDRDGVIDAVKQRCDEIVNKGPHIFYPKILERNVEKIREIIELNDIEADILKFSILLHDSQCLEDLEDLLDVMNSSRLMRVLATILGYPLNRIKEAFSPKAMLHRSGLVTIDRDGARNLKGKLDLLSTSFADMMMNYEGDDIYELFKEAVRLCEPGTLYLSDYSYMQKEIDTILPYLRHAVCNQFRGTNILLYGPPGTGKTEFAKAIAHELSQQLFEVSYADDDDEPISGRQRINAFKSAQYLFGKKPVLLMFDEMEDISEDEVPFFLFGKRPRQKNKGWMNRMLERSKVPTVWITNSIGAIDNATIRRFDMIVEMPIPPKSKRAEIIRAHFGDRLEPGVVETIAEHPHVAPAILTCAAKVVERVGFDRETAQKSATMLISATLKAQGFNALGKPGSFSENDYDPTLVNTKEELSAIAEGIVRHQNARLGLYGPPGTGKSAFGRWIAKRLDAPLLVKKGSDLLSMFVGGTEKNIAAAFEEAERENAVLLFDEVDSFLQDRREAQRSWEITQVNELLTQMESFEGVFIATTNLMENLDQASLRRFDLKLAFGYMRPRQAVVMFERACRELGLPTPDKTVIRTVEAMKNLTPGDFAAVGRQHRFCPIASPIELVERLMEECAVKEEAQSGTMGFLV